MPCGESRLCLRASAWALCLGCLSCPLAAYGTSHPLLQKSLLGVVEVSLALLKLHAGVKECVSVLMKAKSQIFGGYLAMNLAKSKTTFT